MRYSVLLFLFLFTACGVHKNIHFVKNEPMVERHVDRKEKEKSRESIIENSEEIEQSAVDPQEGDLASVDSTISLSIPKFSQNETKTIAQAKGSDPDPNEEIIEEAVKNERKAKVSLSWSITSLVLDFIFPYIGIPLTIGAIIYYFIVDRNRYFTVRGDRMMRTSMILLIVQGALLIALATIIILLLLIL